MRRDIRSTVLTPTECAIVTTASKKVPKEAEVYHKIFKVALHSNFLDQEVSIGGTLSVKEQMKLCSLLKENLDVFAWQPSDVTRVDGKHHEEKVKEKIKINNFTLKLGITPSKEKSMNRESKGDDVLQLRVEGDHHEEKVNEKRKIYNFTLKLGITPNNEKSMNIASESDDESKP
nr:hypothetical protein [Tanacetum cinerariifolium]